MKSYYEKPSLHKYGTMKDLTFGGGGSPSDGMGGMGASDPPGNTSDLNLNLFDTPNTNDETNPSDID